MKSLYGRYKQINALYDSITNTKSVCANAKGKFTTYVTSIQNFVNDPFTTIDNGTANIDNITDDTLRIAIFEEFSDKLDSYYDFTEETTQPTSGTYTEIDHRYYKISPKPNAATTNATPNVHLGRWLTFKKYFMPELDNFVEDKVWAEKDTGNILLSNNEGVTYSLAENGTFVETIPNDTQSFIDFITYAKL